MIDQQAFLGWLHQSIPLTKAMQIDQLEWTGESLRLSAPLAPNINDKGTGFAAATSGVATLSGWTLITLWLNERNLYADVMIARSDIDYRAPVTGRFSACARFSDVNALERFEQSLQTRGRARIDVEVELGDAERPELKLKGSYVAVSKGESGID